MESPRVTLFFAGKALEKAGGKEFLETVKELRKSQGPLEVAEGKCGTGLHLSRAQSHPCNLQPPTSIRGHWIQQDTTGCAIPRTQVKNKQTKKARHIRCPRLATPTSRRWRQEYSWPSRLIYLVNSGLAKVHLRGGGRCS